MNVCFELEFDLVLDALEHHVTRGVFRDPPRSSSQLADHSTFMSLARDQ